MTVSFIFFFNGVVFLFKINTNKTLHGNGRAQITLVYPDKAVCFIYPCFSFRQSSQIMVAPLENELLITAAWVLIEMSIKKKRKYN